MFPSFNNISDRHRKRKSLLERLELEQQINNAQSDLYEAADWNGTSLLSLDGPKRATSTFEIQTDPATADVGRVIVPRIAGNRPVAAPAPVAVAATPRMSTMATQTRTSRGDRAIQTDSATYGVMETQTDPMRSSEADLMFKEDLYSELMRANDNLQVFMDSAREDFSQAMNEFNELSATNTMTGLQLYNLKKDFELGREMYLELQRRYERLQSKKEVSDAELAAFKKEYAQGEEYYMALQAAYKALQDEYNMTVSEATQTVDTLRKEGAAKTAELLALHERLNTKEAIPLDPDHLTEDRAKRGIAELYSVESRYANDLIAKKIRPFKNRSKKQAPGAYIGENGVLKLTKENTAKNMPTDIDWRRTYLHILKVIDNLNTDPERNADMGVYDEYEEKAAIGTSEVRPELSAVAVPIGTSQARPQLNQEQAEALVSQYLTPDNKRYGQHAAALIAEGISPIRMKKANGETVYSNVALVERAAFIPKSGNRTPKRDNVDWIRTLEVVEDRVKRRRSDSMAQENLSPQHQANQKLYKYKKGSFTQNRALWDEDEVMEEGDGGGMHRKGGQTKRGRFNKLLYKTIGARKVHLPSLQKGYLSVRHMNGTMAGRKTKIDDQLLRLIKTFVFEDHIDQPLYDSLEIEDQAIFSELLRASRIQSTLKDGWKSPREALKAKYDKLMAQIDLGNDSVLPELKKVLVDMFSQGMISDKQFKSLLEHLL